MKNKLKEKLKAGEQTVGVWMSIPSPEVGEALAAQGRWDWFVYDMEHSPLNEQIVNNIMTSVKGTDVVPLARVAWNDMVLIKRALDVGAYGVVVPWVNNREQAIRAVQACKYPPDGLRGVGPRRASIGDPRYLATANDEVLVIAQIETKEAVENCQEIFSVKGIDAYFIGPMDLSASLGVLGKTDDPKMVEAIDRVWKAGKQAGLISGIYSLGVDDLKRRLAQGFQFIAAGGDLGFLTQGAEATLKQIGRSGR